MNVVEQLPFPLNTFVVDVPAQTYYDFELPSESDYPLKGVIYPVDYGHIPDYTAEDGHELDLFVGKQFSGAMGYIEVYRSEVVPRERKFFVGLSMADIDVIATELKPVLVNQYVATSVTELAALIEKYKN